MKNRIIFILLTILYIGGASFFAKCVVDDMNDFKTNKIAYSERASIKELSNYRNYVFSSEYDDAESEAGQLFGRAEVSKKKAEKNAVFLGVVSLIYFLIVFLLYKRKLIDLTALGLGIVVISAVFLVSGVFAPMVEIMAYLDGVDVDLKGGFKDIPLLGDYLPDKNFDFSTNFGGKLYAMYQSKSIADIIGILFKAGNYFVGIAILLFSVIFPVLKLLFSSLFLLSKTARNKDLFVNTVSYIGKYSMADVFVVAIFLAIMAIENMGNSSVVTEGHVLVGMYLFTFYCILSIGVFYVIKAMKKQLSITAVNGDKVITDLDQEIIS